MRKRWLLAAAIAALVALFFTLDLGRHLTLDALKASREALTGAYASHPFGVIAGYFTIYVLVTALCIPGATVLTLAGGATFGVVTGTLLVSFASATGATLAFLASRHVMRDAIQQRFGDKLMVINDGITKNGASYLLTLRLMPVFPFVVINLALGLTPLATRTFYWVSQVGMFPATVIYVNAGTQLAAIDRLSAILSPVLLASLALLGILPLVAKQVIDAVAKRRDQ